MSACRAAELLIRWHAGDAEALHQSLDRHLEWIRSVVRRELGPELRAKVESGDLVQEALLDFLSHGPRIKPASGEQFRAIVARIVINAVRDRYAWFRAKRRDMTRERPLSRDSTVDLSKDSSALPPDEVAAQAELEARIRLVIELMSPSDRQVLILREWEQKSFEEIAQELQISSDAVRMRYQRAIPRLREGLEALRSGDVDRLLRDPV